MLRFAELLLGNGLTNNPAMTINMETVCRIAERSAMIAAVFILVACESGQPPRPTRHIVKDKIYLKDLATSVKVPGEARHSKTAFLSYFGAKRSVKFETLDDGTVTAIKFHLNDDNEGDKLKDELAKKFISQGNEKFWWLCSDDFPRINILNHTFQVKTQTCLATDGQQTLSIITQHQTIPSDVTDKLHYIKNILNIATVHLYNNGLQDKKEADDMDKIRKKIQADAESAAKDI